jgi:hypothetical protein
MTESSKELGVMSVLLDRFANRRLPRMLEIKKRVDAGERLAGHELEFLEVVGADTIKNLPKIAGHAELKDLLGKALNLYHEIVTKAMENEQNSGSDLPK